MGSKKQIKEDAVFQQAQEIFTQMEPEVIYMVLSECDFNLDQAMESLIMLGQGEEVGMSHQKQSESTYDDDITLRHQSVYHSLYSHDIDPPLAGRFHESSLQHGKPDKAKHTINNLPVPNSKTSEWSLSEYNVVSANVGSHENQVVTNERKRKKHTPDLTKADKLYTNRLSASSDKTVSVKGKRRSVRKDPVSMKSGNESTATDSCKKQMEEISEKFISSSSINVSESEKLSENTSFTASKDLAEINKLEDKSLAEISSQLVGDTISATKVSDITRKFTVSMVHFSYTGIGDINGVRLSFSGESSVPTSVLGLFPSREPEKLFQVKARKQRLSNSQQILSQARHGAEVQERDSEIDRSKDPTLRNEKHLDIASFVEQIEKSTEEMDIENSHQNEVIKRQSVSPLLPELNKDTNMNPVLLSGDDQNNDIAKTGSPAELDKLEAEQDMLEDVKWDDVVIEKNENKISDAHSVDIVGIDSSQSSASILKPMAPEFVLSKNSSHSNAPPGFNLPSQGIQEMFNPFANPPDVRRISDPLIPMSGSIPSLPYHLPVHMQVYPGPLMYESRHQGHPYGFAPSGYFAPPQRPQFFHSHPNSTFSQTLQKPAPVKDNQKSSLNSEIGSHAGKSMTDDKRKQQQGMNIGVNATSLGVDNSTGTRSNKLHAKSKTSTRQKILYILRGLPGSGKSTLAARLVGKTGRILSSDDYFMRGNRYNFNPMYIGEAHEWNQKRAKRCVQEGVSPVIIDNTNMAAWEMKPYAEIAIRHCYQVEIREPNTPWKFKAGICARKNKHSVPAESIRKMLEKYEGNMTVEKVLMSGGNSLPKARPASEVKSYQLSRPIKNMGQISAEVTRREPQGSLKQSYAPEHRISKFNNTAVVLNGKESHSDNESNNSPVTLPLSCSTPFSSSCPVQHSTVNQSKKTIDNSSSESKPSKFSLQPNVSEFVDEKSASTNDIFISSSRNSNALLSCGPRQKFLQKPRPKSLSPRRQTRNFASTNSQRSEHRFPFKKNRDNGEGGRPKNKPSRDGGYNHFSESSDETTLGSVENKPPKTDFHKNMDENLEESVSTSNSQKVESVADASERFQKSHSSDLGEFSDAASSEKDEVPNNQSEVNPSEDIDRITEVFLGGNSASTICSKTDFESVSIEKKLETAGQREVDAVKKSQPQQSQKRHSKLAAVFQSDPVITQSTKAKLQSQNDWSRLVHSTSPGSRSKETSSVEAECTDSKRNNQDNDVESSLLQRKSVADRETRTDSMVFTILRKLDMGLETADGEGLTVLSGNSNRFVAASENAQPSVCRKVDDDILKLHKSSSTTDLEDSLKGKEKQMTHDLDTLKLVFDHVPADTLNEVYQDCDRDLEWTSNILAESSMFGNNLYKFDSASKELSSKLIGDEKITQDSPEKMECLEEKIVEESDFKTKEGKTADILKGNDDSLNKNIYHESTNYEVNDFQLTGIEDEYEQTFKLRLPKDFLCALVRQFGGLSSDDDNLTQEKVPETCTVEIGVKLAKEIHSLWIMAQKRKQAMKESVEEFQRTSIDKDAIAIREWERAEAVRLQKQYEQDEMLARRLQHAEERGEVEYQKPPIEDNSFRKIKKKNVVINNTRENTQVKKPDGGWSTGEGNEDWKMIHDDMSSSSFSSPSAWSTANKSSSTTSMIDIMLEEAAAQESEMKQREENWDKLDFSTQMKRKQLHEMYPGLPKDLLDDIFNANSKNLESTIYSVNCLWLDGAEPPTYVLSEYAREVFDSQALEMHLMPDISSSALLSKPETLITTTAKLTTVESSENISVVKEDNSSYEELRAEANLHKEHMEEAFRKAAIAYQQQKRPVSTYYAHQGHLHRMKFKEANKRAAEVIYQQKNIGRDERNEIDLHGLHVSEAVSTLARKLSEKRDPGKKQNIFVITGRGVNSQGGIPKIKNAVMEWLKANNHEFTIVNAGMLRINL